MRNPISPDTRDSLTQMLRYALAANKRLVPSKAAGAPWIDPEAWGPLAEALAAHLELAGFRIEAGPGARAHSTTDHMR